MSSGGQRSVSQPDGNLLEEDDEVKEKEEEEDEETSPVVQS